MDCKEAFEKYYSTISSGMVCESPCEKCEQDSYVDRVEEILEKIETLEDNIEIKEEWIEAFRETIDRLEDKIIEYKEKIAMSHRLIQKNKQEIKEVN